MKASCLIAVGLVYTVAGAAEAQSLSVSRPHAAKRSTHEAAVSKSASLGPYETSGPGWKAMSAQFSPVRTNPAVDSQTGFSLTAGRDFPDAPFTGGLKLRF